MINHWREFIWSVAEAETLLISGVRKIAQDLSLELPYEALAASEGISFEDIGYTRGKYRQLARNYWDEEAVEAAMQKLEGRQDKPHTSVSIQLKNGAKDSRSQGFCMQNMVITHAPGSTPSCTVDIYYRSTEATQKFLADLIFFAEVLPPLFERVGFCPSMIRFKFANVYLSAVFMPIFLRFEEDPVGFFDHLEDWDPRFYRTCGLATSKFFKETHNYSYRTRVKMFEYAREHISPKKFDLLKHRLKGLKGEVSMDEEDEE